MAKAASRLVKRPTTVEEAIESNEIKAAICRGIFRITRLREPVTRPRNGGASRDRLDWQDVYSKIVLKLSDPSVRFAETNFAPAYAYGVARNTAGEWLRERMKERPRRGRKLVAEQQDETVVFQTVQFDPKLKPMSQPDAERLPNTKGILALEEILDHSDYQVAKGVLEDFALACPEDHAWLVAYMTTRRLRKRTNADHQRAARLCRKLRQLLDEEWNWEPGPDEESEDDSEVEIGVA